MKNQISDCFYGNDEINYIKNKERYGSSLSKAREAPLIFPIFFFSFLEIKTNLELIFIQVIYLIKLGTTYIMPNDYYPFLKIIFMNYYGKK